MYDVSNQWFKFNSLANMLVSGRFLMSGVIVPLQNKLVGGSTKFKQFITNTIQA